MKITIRDKEYEFRYSTRALLEFEEITGKRFDIINFSDECLTMYCMFHSSNLDTWEFTYPEFLEIIDEQPEIPFIFKKVLENKLKTQEELMKKYNSEGDNLGVKKNS